MHKNRWRFSSVGRPQFGVNTDKSRDQAEVKPILNSVLFPVNILSSSNQLETKYPNKFSFNDMLIFTQNFHILSKPGRFHLDTVNLQNSPRQYGAKNFGYTEDNIWHFPAGPIQPNSQPSSRQRLLQLIWIDADLQILDLLGTMGTGQPFRKNGQNFVSCRANRQFLTVTSVVQIAGQCRTWPSPGCPQSFPTQLRISQAPEFLYKATGVEFLLPLFYNF